MQYEQLAEQVDLVDIGRSRKSDFAGLPEFAQLSLANAPPQTRDQLSRFASISVTTEAELAKCRRHLLNEKNPPTIKAYRDLLDALTPGVIAALRLPPLSWLGLARLAVLDFRFSLALELRTIAKVAARETRDGDRNSMHLRMRIALEDSNLPMLSGAIAALQSEMPPFMRHRYLYLDEPTPKAKLNRTLAPIVTGKRVALVGPVDTGLMNGPEIESFDVVVRFNYSDPSIYAPDKFGSRTDVSYYAVEDIGLLEGKDLSHMSELQVAVVPPGKKGLPVWERAGVPVVERIGVDSKDTSPFILGVGAGAQRMLLDILRYSPKIVKLFNANMFAKKGAVPGYRAVKHNFHVWHEPFSNFIFTKRLLDTGRIEADEMMRFALNLPLADYAVILEQQFREGYLSEATSSR